jgi:Spy/CpxP family protein refolding chaperone
MKPGRVFIFLYMLVFGVGAFSLQSPTSPSPSGQDEAKQSDHGDKRHSRRGHMPDVDAHVKHLTQMLDLTEDQQTAVKNILQEQHQQAETVLQDKSLSKEDRTAKLQSLHDTAHSKIRELLIDDQKKKFDDQMQRMQEHKKHSAPG